MSLSRATLCTVCVAFALASCGSDDGATATLTAPAAGAVVAGGVELEMTADGIAIEEAGEARDGAGHLHVIADAGCVSEGAAIGKDADHVHFGKGQISGRIYLEPGTHELCLQVGDGTHNALDITDRRTIEVGIADQDEFCYVVKEIDDLFDMVDSSSDDFAVKQVTYENIRRLAAQLTAGLDVVDASSRDDLAATATFVDEMTSVLVGATDMAEAEQALVPVFETMGEELPGTEWILDNCGVDISGDE